MITKENVGDIVFYFQENKWYMFEVEEVLERFLVPVLGSVITKYAHEDRWTLVHNSGAHPFAYSIERCCLAVEKQLLWYSQTVTI